MTGGNIKKSNFVSALLVIATGHFYRVTGIADIDKLHAFYHSAFVHIQTGNNSFSQSFWLICHLSSSLNICPNLPALVSKY